MRNKFYEKTVHSVNLIQSDKFNILWKKHTEYKRNEN